MGASEAEELDGAAPRKRRKRRTRDEVEGRIIAVARELFAQRGYSAATTREIARIADVSETLLFRYFGDKAQLFDAVVVKPFNELMADFISRQQQMQPDSDGAHQMFVAVFDLFENNRELLSAAYLGRGGNAEGVPPLARGLAPFFQQSAQSQARDNRGCDPGLKLTTGIPLAFGMIASAVLLREWLFTDEDYDRDEVVATLETMVRKALGPAAQD